MRSTARCALSLLTALLLLYIHDRTHLNGTVAGARAPLSPGDSLLDARGLYHEVAGELFLRVGIGAVNHLGLAIAYPNAGCGGCLLKAHAGPASRLRERFVEGRV